MRYVIAILSCTTLLLITGCGGSPETVTPPPAGEQEANWQKASHDPARIARGKELYMKDQKANCWNCHGKEGKGHKQLRVPSLLDDRWVYGSRMEDIFKSIKKGRANGRMPGVHEHFDDEAILDLAIFIADWNRTAKDNETGWHAPGEKLYPIDY